MVFLVRWKVCEVTCPLGGIHHCVKVLLSELAS